MIKKTGEISTSEVLYIIMALIIILAIVVFIAKPYILDWIRSQPEYNYTYDEEINITQTDSSAVSTFCPIPIGRVQYVGKPWYEAIIGRVSYNYISVATPKGEAKTELLWEEEKNRVMLDENVNKYVGSINVNDAGNLAITIDKSWFQDSLRKGHSTIPSKEILRWLDGAYKIDKKSSLICRKDKIYIIKVGSSINVKDLPLNWKLSKENLYIDDYGNFVSLNAQGEVISIKDKNNNKIDKAWILRAVKNEK